MDRASVVVLGSLALLPALFVQGGAASQKTPVEIPKPGVPQIMTIQGKFVRAAYNNEGYVIVGYQATNRSIGEKWMLLEIGVALRDKARDYTLKREALSLDTPGGKTIPLPSVTEHRAGNTIALQNRANIQRDSINYFPPNAHQACRIGFFAELDSRAMPWDQVELNSQRACLGRVFFEVPEGIQYGQYWLNVKFANSVVRVPFRIMTDEEEEFVSKNFKEIKDQLKEAFAPKSN